MAGLFIGGTFLLAAGPVAADDHSRGHATVIRDDLSSPKGLAIGSKTSLLLAQGAYGPPGPVLAFEYRGRHRGTFTPLTDAVNLVDVVVTPDGAGWGIGEDRILYRQAVGGAIQPILDIAAYQKADPDPYNNPAEDPSETNPFGLAALKSDDVLLADAAGNDVIRVQPNGHAWTVARWTRELVKTDKVGDPTLPPKLPAEAVPTSIAIGRDGKAYVGQLVGFPGRPGSAKVWRIDPNAKDALCSLTMKDRHCKVWKKGFTSIVDLAFDPDNGTLYVYEIAKAGWLAFEAALSTGSPFPKAVLLEVRRHHGPRELVKGKLSEPGGIVVTKNGSIFVTDGMFSSGRLLRVRH